MNKRKLTFRRILIILLLSFAVMQFFRIDKSAPEVVKVKDFISMVQPDEATEKLLRDACYDCHSNETKYPWYSNVAPVSWWLQHHVEEGREHLNFSTWGDYDEETKNHKLHECEEEVEEGEMPLSSYTITHGDAKLSKEQKEELAEWFESLMTAEAEEH